MTDREKLVELIKLIDEHYQISYHRQAGEIVGILNTDELTADLIAHGVTVKEMQKPMTVEELFLLPDVVYVEFSYFDDVYAALPERYDKQTIDLMMRGESCRFLLKGYGKTWRCWAKRPTEEERKAAEWLK